MPFSGGFTDDATGIVEVGHGIVTGEELLVETQRLAAAGRDALSAVRYALVAFSAVSEFKVTADETARLAAEDVKLAKAIPELSIAVVAPTPITFGMSRMWEALAHATGWR